MRQSVAERHKRMTCGCLKSKQTSLCDHRKCFRPQLENTKSSEGADSSRFESGRSNKNEFFFPKLLRFPATIILEREEARLLKAFQQVSSSYADGEKFSLIAFFKQFSNKHEWIENVENDFSILCISSSLPPAWWNLDGVPLIGQDVLIKNECLFEDFPEKK